MAQEAEWVVVVDGRFGGLIPGGLFKILNLSVLPMARPAPCIAAPPPPLSKCVCV